MESVLAAYRMSVLMGSHEGYIMVRRAIFGLAYWSVLPEPDRRFVVRDVLTSLESPDRDLAGRYRKIITAKSDSERDSIRGGLLASGVATKDVLQALGV